MQNDDISSNDDDDDDNAININTNIKKNLPKEIKLMRTHKFLVI